LANADESRLIGRGEIPGEIGQPEEHQVGHLTIRRVAAEQSRNGRHRLTAVTITTVPRPAEVD
jgi:hypothetical protein